MRCKIIVENTYRFEDGFIGLVINTIPEWVIHSIILPLPGPNVL